MRSVYIMFRLQGDQVEIYRYSITVKEGELETVFYAVTKEEADKIVKEHGGILEQIDTAQMEWFDGMTIKPTNKPMEEASKILEMGEEGYKKWLEQQAAQSPEKLVEENEKLKQQLTDTQLALVEVYEMMLPS